MEKRYLCIDVGGNSIKYGIVDEALKIYERGDAATPYDGVEPYLDTLEGIYRQYEGTAAGIAMSVPGMIDNYHGICITGGNLRYIEKFPLAQRLKERCGLPVSVMNDAKCAALAESTWGSLADCQDAIVLVFGTGIGGALVKDGRVHMGKHFSAGEFSFIMMGQECDLEANSWAVRNGNRRLIHMASRARGVKPEGVTGYDVFQWAEAGDEGVKRALNQFTKDIAVMIMNLQAIFDPERFAIGGGISRQSLFLEYIRKNLDYCHSMLPFEVPKAEVTACKFFNDANLFGALGHHLTGDWLKD